MWFVARLSTWQSRLTPHDLALAYLALQYAAGSSRAHIGFDSSMAWICLNQQKLSVMEANVNGCLHSPCVSTGVVSEKCSTFAASREMSRLAMPSPQSSNDETHLTIDGAS